MARIGDVIWLELGMARGQRRMDGSADVPREALLDRVLDRSVVLGYGRIGFAVRSRQWSDDVRPGMLAGRTGPR